MDYYAETTTRAKLPSIQENIPRKFDHATTLNEILKVYINSTQTFYLHKKNNLFLYMNM